MLTGKEQNSSNKVIKIHIEIQHDNVQEIQNQNTM